MKLGGERLKWFLRAVAFAAVLSVVTVSPASAGSFDDGSPCPAEGAILVCPNGVLGADYRLELKAYGGCDIYIWALGSGSSLPAGLSMTSDTGLITGRPTGAGTTVFWVEITDRGPDQGGYPWCTVVKKSEREFKITIEPSLGIVNQSVKQGTVGTAYSEKLAASSISSLNPFAGSPVSATWTVQSGVLPPGVSLSPDGVLAGTPTAEGSFQFVARAQNGAQSDTETLTLVVRQPVVITSPFTSSTPPKSEVGVPFTATLTGAGGNSTPTTPLTWALASGSLPDGVTLSTAGAITIAGTPTVAGTFPFSITASDNEGRTTKLDATLEVAAKLAVKTLRLPAAKVGKLYQAKIATLGGVAPFSWKVVRGPNPVGVLFNRTLGSFGGKPRAKGTYPVTVEVTDALGVKAQKTFSIVVAPKAKPKTKPKPKLK